MTRSRLLALAVIVALGSAAISARRPEQAPARRPTGIGANYQGPAFTFTKIADGVYHAIGTGSIVVMSNAAIVEGDRDVLVVDSHVSPGGAWALQEELKAVTAKPIRWVVNSHYHFDHSHGNQIYGPEVQIIGHDFTRAQMVAGKSQDSPAREFFVGGVPGAIKVLEGRLAAATDDKVKAQIQEQLAIQRNHFEGTNAVKPTPPTMTLSQSMTLHLGSREVRLLFLGRGHTAGDVVVHLPKERIVATGDLLINGPSYMGDAFFTDWVQTMETLKGVEFDTILPGHGRPMTGKASLDHWQAY
ncbi:MAG: MBL fold metallo-hydrolase, partial [Acidimicrobiia bacterium]|nr:MBL fold metallo-hydrolase [Acidimicrobiia bacterium]